MCTRSHQAKSVWPPEELVRTGTERSFKMRVELEPQYTVKGTRKKLLSSRALSVVGGLLMVVSIAVVAVFNPEAHNFVWVPVILGVLSLLIGSCYSHTIAMRGAYRMAGLRQQAEQSQTKAWLLDMFRPTQEQANRKLSILALRMDLAGKKLAAFYSENPQYLVERAAGRSPLVDSLLVRQEKRLKCEVEHTKAAFEMLYDALKDAGLVEKWHEQGGWKGYLTHCGVGPDDPEVVDLIGPKKPEHWDDNIAAAEELGY